MIDFTVCSVGFALGIFGSVVASLLNILISTLFQFMQG